MPEDISNPTFEVGDRIKLNKLGMERSPRVRAHRGRIIGKTRSGFGFQVLLDGAKTATHLHHTYIERDET